MCDKVQKILDKSGVYKPPSPAAGKNYDDLPVLGPYKYELYAKDNENGTYNGQYKNGKRHGFGTWVSILLQFNSFNFVVFFVEYGFENSFEFLIFKGLG